MTSKQDNYAKTSLQERLQKILGCEVDLKEISEGINDLYRVETEEDSFILKIENNEYSEEKYFEAEPEIYRRLSKNSEIKVPDIIHEDFSKRKIPKDFFLMEELEGRNPDKEKEKLSQTELEKLIQDYGEQLGLIHSELSFEKYGFLEFRDGDLKAEEEVENWREMTKLMVNERLKRAEDSWNLEEVEPELLEPKEEWFKVVPEKCTPVLYHSDNRLENLLINDEGITAFLDWAKIRTAHNILDLAAAEFLLIEYDLRKRENLEKDKLKEKLYEGYKETNNFKRNSDFEKLRNLYRYLTISWLLMGFPTWSEDRKPEDRIDLAKWINQKMQDEVKKIRQII